MIYVVRSTDLHPRAYAQEVDKHKRTFLLVNKADLLPFSVREKWARYFHHHGILFIFWSAKAASAILEGKTLSVSSDSVEESVDSDTKIYGREELLVRLQYEAEEIVWIRNTSDRDSEGPYHVHSPEEKSLGAAPPSVTVAFVGYPNVGKSSTINALVGEKRTGVTSTPGKTKHFQTLIISERLTLCDCPGLVFPSFTSSRYEMIASGVLPVDRIYEHREAVQVVANRVRRQVIEGVYNISLPRPKVYESQSRPPLASEFLRAYCTSRGYVAASGLPDETRAARQILKDYINGKPLGLSEEEAGKQDAGVVTPISEIDESEESDSENLSLSEYENVPSFEHVLEDLNSFDMAIGLAPNQRQRRKKTESSAHKQHKKPQRKKDQSWRTKNDESDGMPVVRVFQKPVNTGPTKV